MRESKLPPLKIAVDRQRALTVTWKDGSQSVYPIAWLRQICPCAVCRDLREGSSDPLRIVQADLTLPDDLHIVGAKKVGHYALSFQFSDGHGSGIYSYTFLLEKEPPAEK
ncbi:MAG: DUF971 domain-containing protein [Candidatus Poribacteria bacterium]|nr:DUF971 domain-containing protein [Candidatus Poribacteria bacterium]